MKQYSCVNSVINTQIYLCLCLYCGQCVCVFVRASGRGHREKCWRCSCKSSKASIYASTILRLQAQMMWDIISQNLQKNIKFSLFLYSIPQKNSLGCMYFNNGLLHNAFFKQSLAFFKNIAWFCHLMSFDYSLVECYILLARKIRTT